LSTACPEEAAGDLPAAPVAAQQMRPAVFARPRRVRQLEHQRTICTAREFFEERLDRRNIGEPVEALAVQAQTGLGGGVAGGVGPATPARETAVS